MPEPADPMRSPERKPRLLFLRWTKAGQPPFLLLQLAEHLACLRQFFEVELVDHDCDYDEVCDRFQPDLALFESGIYAGPRSVRNVHTHPEVPKLGFLNADAFDPVRATFVADMAAWGVETFFTISVSMAEYTPEIADRLFTWPNFVDDAVHRDHDLPRTVPVLLTGSQARHYPWRSAVSRVLAQYYPTLSMPHFGWADSASMHRMTVGEGYSRLLGSALVAPTCGSVTRDVVRKHLEIPAAGTCLLTEGTPALEAAGFEDMVSCVYADVDDVVDKVDLLLTDRDLLESISAAGHALVHERHTIRQRRQVRDWYDLWTAHGDAGVIEQRGPFEPLTLRAEPFGPTGPARPLVVGRGKDRVLLEQGWAAVAEGRHAAASRAFLRASNYHYMPEAEVAHAYVELLRGGAAGASGVLDDLLEHNVRHHLSPEPDPVQWSLHLRALLCRGRLRQAAEDARRHPGLQHPELARTRWVVSHLASTPVPATAAAPRATVNPLPPLPWADWLAELRQMLRANGHRAWAGRLGGLDTEPDPARVTAASPASPVAEREQAPAAPSPERRPAGRLASLAHRVAAQATAQPRQLARRIATPAWMDLVAEVAEREQVETAVIVGPQPLNVRERALRRALGRNPRLPRIVEVPDGSRPSGVVETTALVYVGNGVPLDPDAHAWVADARIVLIDGGVRPGVPRLLDRLTELDFELVSYDVRRWTGFFVLRHVLGGAGALTRPTAMTRPSTERFTRGTS